MPFYLWPGFSLSLGEFHDILIDYHVNRFYRFKMNHLALTLAVGVICCSSIIAFDPSQITDTLSLANDLGGFIESQDFSKTASKLISTVSPFLGIIGSVLSFAFGFLNSGPSAELLAIQRLYHEVSTRFDRIDQQFAAVTREIQWVSIEAHYGTFESTIHSIGDAYGHLTNSKSKAEYEARKFLFKDAFRSYNKAGEQIYDGIMGQSNMFNAPIFDEAITHLKWDRKKIQEFMLGVTKLLINAAAIEVAYYQLINPSTAPFIQHDWEVRFEHLQSTMLAVDNRLATKFGNQVHLDVEEYISHHEHDSNCDITNKLHDIISKKYYWRNWLVVTTDHSTDNHKFMAHACGGGTINRQYNKNVVVASVDKNKAHLTTTEQRIVNSVQTTHTIRIMHGGKRDLTKRVGYRRNNADIAYNTFPSAARAVTCDSHYAAIGVIDHSLHTCWRSPYQHLFSRAGDRYYEVFAFG